MYPHERSLVQKLADKPFALVGVNSDESPQRLRQAMEKNDITWPSFFDGGMIGGPIATRWRVTGWPTIYVLDADGVIRARDLRGEALAEKVLELLKEIE
ncbi:MAG: TlpA family protein disulfide reductase [Planctomycetota bacterium]|nr:MAG: TlpA family protein disulfide reductase [Planctomycetota bacterium]